jgi:Tol biopolymer transport system component
MKIFFSFTIIAAFSTTIFAQPKSPYSIKDPAINIITYRADIDNAGVDRPKQFPGAKPLPESMYLKKEKHLKNIRQLSFEGENAEAYLSTDDSHISFQARGPGDGKCDQIFTMTLDGKNVREISTGSGRTTCSYYLPDNDHILYSSTQAIGAGCPSVRCSGGT